MAILPISDNIVPQYNDTIRKNAEKMLQGNNESVVPAENFYFTKNTIKLNQALGKSKLLFWIVMLNFVVYYAISLLVPIFMDTDGCQYGLRPMGFVIYGIYAVIIFLFELFLYKFMMDTLADKRALQFSPLSVIHIIMSQSAKFDVFTDMIFIVNLFDCHDHALARAGAFFITFSVLFNWVSVIMTVITILKDKKPHFSSYINRYAKLALTTELCAIGHALDKFSTSNTVKWGNIYLPQIMVSAVGKFALEDFPQFILQLLKLFVFSNGQANVGLSLASTFLSLILSFRTAMKARPSVCKAEHVERLIKRDGRRVGQTDVFEENDYKEQNTLGKYQTFAKFSKLSGSEDEENLLANLQNSQLSKNQSKEPGTPSSSQAGGIELSQVNSERTLTEDSF